MGLQGLGLQAVHRIERVTGLHVLRATVNNGSDDYQTWWFTTHEHQHGWFDRRTGEWELPGWDNLHTFPMCTYLFGSPVEDPRVRDGSWGRWCHGRAGHPSDHPLSRWHAVAPLHPVFVCPSCTAERADYEGQPGKYLPTCPNCGSSLDPVPARKDTPVCTPH